MELLTDVASGLEEMRLSREAEADGMGGFLPELQAHVAGAGAYRLRSVVLTPFLDVREQEPPGASARSQKA